jgi:hypothetical protein
MTEPAPATTSAPQFTLLASDATLACTDEACAMPGVEGTATAN